MGATATSINLSLSGWKSYKPADYKGTDLDNALSDFETYRGKSIRIDADALTVTDLKAALKWMEAKLAGLQAIDKATKKAAGELGKSDDNAWKSAASFAESTGEEAKRQAGKIK